MTLVADPKKCFKEPYRECPDRITRMERAKGRCETNDSWMRRHNENTQRVQDAGCGVSPYAPPCIVACGPAMEIVCIRKHRVIRLPSPASVPNRLTSFGMGTRSSSTGVEGPLRCGRSTWSRTGSSPRWPELPVSMASTWALNLPLRVLLKIFARGDPVR